MKTQSLCALALTFLLTSWSQPAWAGSPESRLLPDSKGKWLQQASTSLPLNDWERLYGIPTGTELRLALEGARTLRGKLVAVTDEALALRTSSGDISAQPRAQVVRVHRMNGDSILNGTLIGVGAGVGIGALLGAYQILTPLTPLDDDKHPLGAFVGAGMLIGGGIGAGVGALVDRAVVKVELVYEK